MNISNIYSTINIKYFKKNPYLNYQSVYRKIHAKFHVQITKLDIEYQKPMINLPFIYNKFYL